MILPTKSEWPKLGYQSAVAEWLISRHSQAGGALRRSGYGQ